MISVCISVYNGERYLRECIDSILNQDFEDFELLIVDDGSTDNSREIVLSYRDSRISLFTNKHNYIESLNFLLQKAKGKYIARMDADDIMLPHRLSLQYDYMESHPTIGVLATSAYYVDSNELVCTYDKDFLVSYQDLLYANPIIHPTAFLRTSVVRNFRLNYDIKYKYAEDYRFWTQCVMHNIAIAVIARPTIKYRRSAQQVSVRHTTNVKNTANRVRDCFAKWVCSQSNLNYRPPIIHASSCQVTVIIPFLNEGLEVIETVKSIRHFVSEQVDIIVINDMSTDEIDYKTLLAPYNVYYCLNHRRLGVAASRDLGVKLSKTPYFLLLDAHMRVYNSLWLHDIVRMLSQDDRQILCMQTKQLWKKDGGSVIELKDVAPVYGAYATFDKNVLSPGIEWNYFEKDEHSEVQNIPCILGAGYAASKRYWTFLLGLKGLKHYGSDEVYISLKVWLEGGRCVLLKTHHFGHIYRDNAPYKISQCNFVYNYLLIAYTLFPLSMWCWVVSCCSIARSEDFKAAYRLLSKNKQSVDKIRVYYTKIFTSSVFQIIKLNTTLSRQRIHEMDRRLAVAHQIIDQLPLLNVSSCGIVKGKTALLIWATLWNKYTKSLLSSFQTECIEEIKEAMFNGQLPFNFCHGYCGIGWGLLFLYANQYLDDIDESILHHIDNGIQTINMGSLKNKSLYYGTAGIVVYVVCRVLYNKYKGCSSTFSSQFLQSVRTEANYLRRTSKEHISVYYSYLYQYIDQLHFKENFLPSLEDWITFPPSLPMRPQYWEYSLDMGCLGYSLPAFLFNVDKSSPYAI